MNFKYCPNCGQQDSLLAENNTDYICNNCHGRYWNNPKAATAVVFISDGKVLFAKRGIEPNKGGYELPGGFVSFGEDVYDCCIREIQEETGAAVSRGDLELLEVYTSKYQDELSTADMVFVVKRWSGDLAANDDVAALEWKPPSFFDDPAFIRPYHNLSEKIKPYLGK